MKTPVRDLLLIGVGLMLASILVPLQLRGCRAPSLRPAADAAEAARDSGEVRLAARAARQATATTADSVYQALRPRAADAPDAIRRHVAPLPSPTRDSIDVHLRVLDSAASAADTVIALLRADTSDLAASARSFRAADSARAVSDSVSHARAERAEAAEQKALTRGMAIGAAGGVAVTLVIVFLTVFALGGR